MSPGGVVAGVATVNNLNATNLSIAGVTTFTGNIDANGNLDVDGHTELDDVNIAGVSTFVGVTTFSANANVGVDTSVGIVMTASNGTRYRLFVEDDGSLSTIALS